MYFIVKKKKENIYCTSLLAIYWNSQPWWEHFIHLVEIILNYIANIRMNIIEIEYFGFPGEL